MSTRITIDHYQELYDHPLKTAELVLTEHGYKVVAENDGPDHYLLIETRQDLRDLVAVFGHGSFRELFERTVEESDFALHNEYGETYRDPADAGNIVAVTADGFNGDLNLEYAWYAPRHTLQFVTATSEPGTYQGWCDDEYVISEKFSLYRTKLTGRWICEHYNATSQRCHWFEVDSNELAIFIRDNRERIDENAPKIARKIADVYALIDTVDVERDHVRDLFLMHDVISGPVASTVATKRTEALREAFATSRNDQELAASIRIPAETLKRALNNGDYRTGQ